MGLAPVVAPIVVDAAGAEAGAAKAATATDAAAGKMKDSVASAGKSIGDSMKEAAKRVGEAVDEILTKFIGAGMGANAAAESIASALDKLSGVSILGPIVEATDKVKDFVLNLNNLSGIVPMSVENIVEIKGAMEEVGASSEHVPDILQALAASMKKATKEGDENATKFKELGFSTDDWKNKMPSLTSVLIQLAEHIKNSKDPMGEMTKAQELLSDNFKDMMPLMSQGGARVKELTEAHAENARAVAGSVETFQHLHKTEAELADKMQTLLIPVFKFLAEALDNNLQGVILLIRGMIDFGHTVVAEAKTVIDAFRALNKITVDLFRPVFEWLNGMAIQVMNKLRDLGQWFVNIGHIALDAFTKVKNFFADLLQPVFKRVGEAVDWVVQKFDVLKSWIGKVKDAIFEMAKPVIDAFNAIAKEIGDFFHMHWGDVAKDAREAAATLGADVKKVLEAAQGPAPAGPNEQFGASVSATVSVEGKKTTEVKDGVAKRTAVVKQGETACTAAIQMAGAVAVAATGAANAQVVKSDKDAGVQAVFFEQQVDLQKLGLLASYTSKVKIIDGKALADAETAEKKSLEKRKETFHKYFQAISGYFTTFINGMITGNQTAAQAFSKMVTDMANQFLQGLEKQLSAFIEKKLMEVFIHESAEKTKDAANQASHAKEGERTAFSAAKHAYDSVVGTPYVGHILAPIAAAAAFAGVVALGSAEGGQYLVPGPQLTMLHAQEMVLPAGLAGRMRDVIDGGGGGGAGAVHVHMNVNAIDSSSFKDTLGKHGHMIGELVTKAMKRKGMK